MLHQCRTIRRGDFKPSSEVVTKIGFKPISKLNAPEF
jgi:hypothetical protein